MITNKLFQISLWRQLKEQRKVDEHQSINKPSKTLASFSSKSSRSSQLYQLGIQWGCIHYLYDAAPNNEARK